jgi:hypothetical protein
LHTKGEDIWAKIQGARELSDILNKRTSMITNKQQPISILLSLLLPAAAQRLIDLHKALIFVTLRLRQVSWAL